VKQAGQFWLPDDDTHFAPFALAGTYQSKQLEAALRHVKRFGLAIDIGAHVGFFTRALGKRFEKVVAFEPQPENFACLKKNRPDNAVLHNVALGSRQCWGALDTPKAENSGAWETKEMKYDNVELVPVMPLDTYDLAPDFVKIDVQGFEEHVLEGGRQTLLKHRPVILIEENATNVNDGVLILQSWGWRRADKVNRDCVMVFE